MEVKATSSSAYITLSVVVITAFIGLLLSGCSTNKPLATVAEVDLAKYAGKWYDVAHLPQRFQKGCNCTSAQYTAVPNETYIKVYNKCRKDGPDGDISDINGKAFPVEGSNNSKLKVQFFWPFKGDYWILDLDKNYQYAMVGNPSRSSLWFLSRKPTLDKATFDMLNAKAKDAGFKVEEMEITPQACSANQ